MSEKFGSADGPSGHELAPPTDDGTPKCLATDRRPLASLSTSVARSRFADSTEVLPAYRPFPPNPRATRSRLPLPRRTEVRRGSGLRSRAILPGEPMPPDCRCRTRETRVPRSCFLSARPWSDLSTRPRPCRTEVRWLPRPGVGLPVLRPHRAAVTLRRAEARLRVPRFRWAPGVTARGVSSPARGTEVPFALVGGAEAPPATRTTNRRFTTPTVVELGRWYPEGCRRPCPPRPVPPSRPYPATRRRPKPSPGTRCPAPVAGISRRPPLPLGVPAGAGPPRGASARGSCHGRPRDETVCVGLVDDGAETRFHIHLASFTRATSRSWRRAFRPGSLRSLVRRTEVRTRDERRHAVH
jgi:hypothetical protein